MEPLLPTCPKCASTERQTKAGKTRADGPRYFCAPCQTTYTPDPQEQRYSSETRHLALKLSLEGNTLRAIARLFSCHRQTVANWVNACHKTLPEQNPQLPGPEVTETIELNELHTFLGEKKVGSISSPQ